MQPTEPAAPRTRASPAATGTKCGATTRTGGTCRHPCGFRTDHPGKGRCYLHGGKSPIRHGRYSAVTTHRLRELIERYEADPDPLDVLPDLAAARALLTDFVERFETFQTALVAWHESWQTDEEGAPKAAKPKQVLDVADAYRQVDVISRIIKREQDHRSASAISRPDLMRVMQEMGRVVERYVPDSQAREAIRDAWLEIRV